MAIGHIKSTSIVDGQITALVETGTGQELTAIVMADSGSEFHPVPGDTVLFHHAGQEVIVSAVCHGEDATTSQGESLMMARGADGRVRSAVHMKSDGSIHINSNNVSIGNGSDAVAMATKVEQLFTVLRTTCGSWAKATHTPDGGVGLATAIEAALLVINTAAQNLKAE